MDYGLVRQWVATPPQWRPGHSDKLALVSMTMLGVIVGIADVQGLSPLPGDALVYLSTEPGQYAVGVYGYPPVLAQLLVPFRMMPGELFVVAWTALCFASLGYALGRWSFVATALLIPEIAFGQKGGDWWASPAASALTGNVTMPMVAAMVAGMRHPGLWAVPILTKVTPGVGLLWFAFRREWRSLAIGISATCILAAVAFVLAPDAWYRFGRFALTNMGADWNGLPIVGPPLWLRLPVAVALVAWGARTNRPWVVPIAAAASLIGLYGWGSFVSVAVAAASPRLRYADAVAHEPRSGQGPQGDRSER